jgi:hypothetical protein
MALSDSVKDSLRDAEGNLRNALAFAARGEKPHVCKSIAEMISNIETLTTLEDIFDKLDNRREGDSGKWGPLTDIGE